MSVTRTVRRLPHWHVLNTPIFITFRLHGSLPHNREFPAASLSSGKAFVVLDRLLDEARSGPTFLREPAIARDVVACLKYGAELGHYLLHAWVIMPNYVHLLITPQVNVSRPLGSLKAASSKRANLLLSRTGNSFWQGESYDHIVRSDDEFRKIQRYIENNPVAAGLVNDVRDYEWSSARRPARPPEREAPPHLSLQI